LEVTHSVLITLPNKRKTNKKRWWRGEGKILARKGKVTLREELYAYDGNNCSA
jgi:hypothetical protein